MYVKPIASQTRDVFETHCIMCFDKAIATSSSAVAKRPRDA